MNHVLSRLVFILPIPGIKVPTQRNPEGSGPKAPGKRAGLKPRPKVGRLPDRLNRTNSTPKGNRNRNQKDRTQRGRHHNAPRGNRTPSLPRQTQGGKRGRAHYATHPPVPRSWLEPPSVASEDATRSPKIQHVAEDPCTPALLLLMSSAVQLYLPSPPSSWTPTPAACQESCLGMSS